MPTEPPWVSVTTAPVGEAALIYMPYLGYRADPAVPDCDLQIYCAHLQEADAALAVSLRATIEHFGRAHGLGTTLRAPAEPLCCRKLEEMLGVGMPDHFELRDSTAGEERPPAGQVLLPATRISGFLESELLASGAIVTLKEHLDTPRARYLAGALGALADNAVSHAEENATDALAAISHDPGLDLTRLVVADTGTGIESDAEADQRLLEAISRSEEFEGGLFELASQAIRLGIPAQVTMASGSGRLRWQGGGEWLVSEGVFVSGTTVIVEVGR